MSSSALDGSQQYLKSSFFFLFLTIFVPFGLGHFVSYLFRTVNAVIYVDLQVDLSLPASSLGMLTGVYFLTFAAAQIDRYGPRSVQAPMLLFAVAGSVIFSISSTETGLLIGRGLVGLGVAGSLMSAIKACAIWLPVERLPLSTADWRAGRDGVDHAFACVAELADLARSVSDAGAADLLCGRGHTPQCSQSLRDQKHPLQRYVCRSRQTLFFLDVLASGVVFSVFARHLHVGTVAVDGTVVA
ncbi:Uncharacterized protein AC496_2700 [Pseudomonas savastanoi pv. glycinea]|uniref:Major facilitator superfamily (MFS) profile domain-containing protein n=1 Tax=Pseudomonas savastanoi pv. glycinea TaxID=318 RepID=A0ABR5L4S5_PSESG|nr:Uncharacterized protein AC498_1860 [Pseudomonas savastanoi pv. glycinea]KPC35185.1 Uncharacterized protein AC497_0538 [Pseudomonas savastanoi pv. glycinea]KPC38798.1 Uncharacterized protein ABK00_2255 [Pseudomonas savastanoi pv. glycinea]KPC39825.1 Uncharacterized protein AC496_2700 [Pseudomonas savastanoi pv. glycinea]